MLADQERMQPDQELDLLHRRARGDVREVPGVDRVVALVAAERDVLGAWDQASQELVVAGAVEHNTLRAARQQA